MAQVAAHAKAVHNLQTATDEVVEKVRQVMRGWKVWPWNDEERVGGGIYLFDGESSAKAYLERPIATGLGQHPAVSDISLKQFEVSGDLTTITRGPV